MDRTCSRGARPIQTVAAAQLVGHVGRHAPSCLSPYNLFFKIPLPYNPREEERETHFSFYFISVRKFVNSIYFFFYSLVLQEEISSLGNLEISREGFISCSNTFDGCFFLIALPRSLSRYYIHGGARTNVRRGRSLDDLHVAVGGGGDRPDRRQLRHHPL